MTKTKGDLISMIDSELVDPESNKITGDRVKAVLTEIVNAIDEGSGGGGTGGGAAMEYWRVPEGLSNTSEEYYIMVMFAMLVRADLTTLGEVHISSGMFATMGTVSDYITAFAFDPATRISMQGALMSMQEILDMLGGSLEDAGFTQIKEDEFYAGA